MEPCIGRSIGMVDIRDRKFSHRRSPSDYYVITSSRVNPNILNNAGGKGRKGEGGKKGRWGEGKVWACEEVKVTGRRGNHIAKVASSTGAPLTFKSCVSLVPATVWFWSF